MSDFESAGVCQRCHRQKMAVNGSSECIYCVGSAPVSGGTIEEVKGAAFAKRVNDAVAVDMEQMKAAGVLVSERPADQMREGLQAQKAYIGLPIAPPVGADPLRQIEALIDAMPFPKTKQEFSAVEKLRKAVKGIIEARKEN